MKDQLTNYINSISDPALRATCETLLHYPDFFTAPASLGFHHAYEGGLLAHTLEVTEIALNSWETTAARPLGYQKSLSDSECFDLFDGSRDILVAACLFHDLLKMREYHLVTDEPEKSERSLPRKSFDFSPMTWWTRSDYGSLIGHISGSAIQFSTAAVNHGVSRATIDAVVHCILAHHGPVREWGSPVAPQTLEATLLHQADMCSAKFGASKEVAP